MQQPSWLGFPSLLSFRQPRLPHQQRRHSARLLPHEPYRPARQAHRAKLTMIKARRFVGNERHEPQFACQFTPTIYMMSIESL